MRKSRLHKHLFESGKTLSQKVARQRAKTEFRNLDHFGFNVQEFMNKQPKHIKNNFAVMKAAENYVEVCENPESTRSTMVAAFFALLAALILAGCFFDKSGIRPDLDGGQNNNNVTIDGGVDAGDAGNIDAGDAGDAGPPPEVCNDGIDNDQDGLTDCADHNDCDGEQGSCGLCQPTEQNCDDNCDNDGDGLTDCEDEANCGGQPNCHEQDCADGLDSDNDGKTDCADEDCQGQQGPNSEICQAVTGETICDDGHDNDANGLTDCDDPNCQDTPTCGEYTCDDGIDNDLDGKTDCEDEDCHQFDDGDKFCSVGTGADPSVFEMHEGNCTDGIDNDGDGYFDCDDVSCHITDPACGADASEICDNGVEDNLPGDPGYLRIDCVQDVCALTDHCEQFARSVSSVCSGAIGVGCSVPGEIGACAQGKCSEGEQFNGQTVPRICHTDEDHQQCY